MDQTDWAEWQKVYQHGIFVIWPPDEIRAMIDPLRQKYSPLSQARIGTHITLTQPFLQQVTEQGWLKLQQIVAGFEPILIDYGPLSTWSEGRIIYLEVQPIEEILALRQAIHRTGLCNLGLPFTEDFIPHITIQEGAEAGTESMDIIDSQQGMENLEALKTEMSHGSFLCTEIAFVVPDSQFHFRVAKRLSLKKRPQGGSAL